jgi:hypothetical protein
MKWLANLLHAADRKNRHYVSPADRLLQEFDAANPKLSTSQLKEIKKHQDIFARETRSRINWS